MGDHSSKQSWRTLANFSLSSDSGNEILAMEKVVAAVGGIDLPEPYLQRLKTAVAETAMNAIEHGNQYRPDLTFKIEVRLSASALSVLITDQGGGREIPPPETPDLEAKLAGLQSPRGWGLFLIKSMVDEMRDVNDGIHHTVELIFNLPEGHDDRPSEPG